jgi:hypothetical protein
MKKTINCRLTGAEKQCLKTKKVNQNRLQDYAPDEIAALLDVSPKRAKELQAWQNFKAFLRSASTLPKNSSARAITHWNSLKANQPQNFLMPLSAIAEPGPIPA